MRRGRWGRREAFGIALAANAPGTGLSDADRAVALRKAKERFGFAEEELVRDVAPLVGLPRSVKVVREFVAIAGLPRVVLDAVASGERSREHASAMLLVQEAEREAFWKEFVEALRLSASETRAVAASAGDVASRERRTLLEVLREIAASVGETSPAERKARFRAELERRVSPVVSAMEAEFEELARSLGLPGGARVEHSRSFETDEVTLTVKAGDEETLGGVGRGDAARGGGGDVCEDAVDFAAGRVEGATAGGGRGYHHGDTETQRREKDEARRTGTGR